MPKSELDRFKAWITSKAEGCLDGDEISELLKIDQQETMAADAVVFCNTEIQNDWETWQAALTPKENTRDA